MSRLKIDDAALVFIDVQTKLWPFMHDREQVGRRTAQLVDIAGILGLPFVVTEQYVKGLGPTIPELKSILEKHGAYRPIEKVSFSCFGEPRFVEALERLKRKTLVVCGIEAHVCVMQTTLDALDRGYDVHLVSEAVSSRFEENRFAGIERMAEAGATVTTVEMAAFEAMATAKHPKFREVQQVIL